MRDHPECITSERTRATTCESIPRVSHRSGRALIQHAQPSRVYHIGADERDNMRIHPECITSEPTRPNTTCATIPSVSHRSGRARQHANPSRVYHIGHVASAARARAQMFTRLTRARFDSYCCRPPPHSSVLRLGRFSLRPMINRP
jgi:hypothetical protein